MPNTWVTIVDIVEVVYLVSCSSALKQLLTFVRGHFGRKKRAQVSDVYDNIWQLF